MIIHTFTIGCDSCDHRYENYLPTKGGVTTMKLRDFLRGSCGWGGGVGRDYCPKCQKARLAIIPPGVFR